MRTKRRYAHELYPHAGEYEVRPLAVEVPYLYAQVPTRFHATVLVHQVLTEMAPWRFQAGGDQVTQGFTQAWMVEPSTPKTHLSTAALFLIREGRR